MRQCVFENETLAAEFAAGEILKIIKAKPDALLCLAAGHSSLPLFSRLISAYHNSEADFSKVRFEGLDEWLGISPENIGSCSNFLFRNLFSPLNISPDQICLFDSFCSNPEAECARIEKHIALCGGIDYMLLGMGMNGHLGLNEPGDSFKNGAHKVALSNTTKEVAKKYFEKNMPPLEHGITLGAKNIQDAKLIHLTVFGAHKEEALKKLLSSPVTEDFPASYLKSCENAALIFDEAAFGK